MSLSVEDLVASSALMRNASEEAFRILKRSRLLRRSLAVGQYIFRPGDSVEAIYLLLGARGRDEGLNVDPLVQVELKPGTTKRALRYGRIVAGEIFGELEFLERGMTLNSTKRITSAWSLTPGVVLSIPISSVFELCEQDSLIRTRIVRTGSQRLLSALEQQHEQLRTDPDLQLADWLVELTVDIGIVEGNRVRFPRRIPQNDIAADLGVSRETISRRLNEWQRSGLLRTGARSQQIEILDYQRVARLATLRTCRNAEALERTINDIDAAIGVGDLARARNIGLDVLRYYPSSPELHHRVSLAAARSGDLHGALKILQRSGLPLDDEIPALEGAVHRARSNPFLPMGKVANNPWVEEKFADNEGLESDRMARSREILLAEDLAALHARLLKEQAFEEANPGAARKKAIASFHSYRNLFDHSQTSYPGINAATMALVSGDLKEAKKISQRLIDLLNFESNEYWPLATLAEALLICDRRSEALNVLARARSANGSNAGSRASTILQFRRLAIALNTNVDSLVRELGQQSVAVSSGHMFRGSEMDALQQAQAEQIVIARAAELLEQYNIGYVYGGLACGSDIILAETALERGLEFNAVLPFGTAKFVDTSVRIGDAPDETGKWEKRFYEVLRSANSLITMSAEEPDHRQLDTYFFYCFRYAAGCALQRAAILQADFRMIAVSDQEQPNGIAGTNQALSDWHIHGRPIDIIPYTRIRPWSFGVQTNAINFRPAVFVWPAQSDTSQKAFDDALSSIARGLDSVSRTHRDGRRGICLTPVTIEQALGVASAAAKQSRNKLPLRVICDFGCVFRADNSLDKKLVAHLQASDDLLGAPTGQVLATESFAMQAKFDLGDKLILIPIGRAETHLGHQSESEQTSICHRPSLSIYTMQWERP